MKKVFKSLMVGALAIPCAFAFTGCGDNSVNVDTSGNYKNIESTQAYTEINTLSESGSLDFGGVRFTIKQDANGNGSNGTVRLDGSAIYNENGVEFAVTINSNVNMNGINADINMSMYMHDKVLYVDAAGQKIKIDLSDDETGAEEYQQYLQMIPNSEIIMETVEALTGTASVTEKSDIDSVVKYHYQATGEDESKSQFWLVVKEGKFDGFKMEANLTLEGVRINSSANIEVYTGTLNFPSFDGYLTAPAI